MQPTIFSFDNFLFFKRTILYDKRTKIHLLSNKTKYFCCVKLSNMLNLKYIYYEKKNVTYYFTCN